MSAAHGNVPDDHTEAMSHSSISSLSSNDSDCKQQQQQQQQQQTGQMVADDKQTVFAGVTGRKCETHANGVGGALSHSSGIAMSSDNTTTAHRSETAASVDAFSQGGQMIRTDLLQSQVTCSAWLLLSDMMCILHAMWCYTSLLQPLVLPVLSMPPLDLDLCGFLLHCSFDATQNGNLLAWKQLIASVQTMLVYAVQKGAAFQSLIGVL